jgi:hypothetical protein
MLCPICIMLGNKSKLELDVDGKVVRLLCDSCGFWQGVAVKYKKEIPQVKKEILNELKDRNQ